MSADPVSTVRRVDGAKIQHLSSALLMATATLLGVGGLLHGVGAGAAGDAAWIGAGAIGAAYTAWSMLSSLRRGRLGVDVIALLALVGALLVGEYLAAGVISLMVASGQSLEAWAAGRARRDLHALLARAPRVAHRYASGELRLVPVEKVVPGDRLLVGTGELVPADGELAGDAVLDESALTGEALPVERAAGEPVRSGVLNAGSPVDLLVTATPAESTYARIVRLVAEAESSQAPFVRLADRYASWFLVMALGVAAVAWALGGAERAVAVLVVATPCPLILAAPVAMVAGLSRAARRGIVIKGSGVLERLARCTTVLLDKTGTLTKGSPALASVVLATALPANEILRLAASLDQVSPHVLAHAIVKAARSLDCDLVLPDDVVEVPGQGIRGTVDCRPIALGKAAWVGVIGSPRWAKSARRRARLDGALTVFVSVDGKPAGVLILDDPIRPDAARTIRALRQSGVKRVVMLTGDRAEVAETVGAVLGVDDVFAGRSPAEKLDVARAESGRAPTIMVGDGINDAPALARADVGVAMGARGATASSETADVVLAVDRLERVGEARSIARRSLDIALQSVVAGMAMSLCAMGVAAAGLLPAVWGAILQEAIDVAVILNALRALRAPASELRLAAADAALTRRFQAEHVAIRSDVDQIRVAADALGLADTAEAIKQVRRAYRLLVDEIGPHEAAEQRELYPAIDRVLGASDPTGAMSRAHVEIAHQTRRLGQLLEDIGPAPPDEVDIAELRGLLYGLYAILRLHTVQEDESYLSIDGDAGPPPEANALSSAVGVGAGSGAGPDVGAPP
jgi:heavy metal translocating P-type ATPase